MQISTGADRITATVFCGKVQTQIQARRDRQADAAGDDGKDHRDTVAKSTGKDAGKTRGKTKNIMLTLAPKRTDDTEARDLITQFNILIECLDAGDVQSCREMAPGSSEKP